MIYLKKDEVIISFLHVLNKMVSSIIKNAIRVLGITIIFLYSSKNTLNEKRSCISGDSKSSDLQYL